MPADDTFSVSQLAIWQATYEKGDSIKGPALLALLDALCLCERRPELTPKWVITAAKNDVVARLFSEPVTAGGRGRTAKAKDRYYEDMKHLERWENVKEVRERQKAHKKILAEHNSKQLPNNPMIEQIRKSLKSGEGTGFGSTFEDAYEAASHILCGTEFEGSADAMKDSYMEVQQAIRSGCYLDRFYQPMSQEAMQFLPGKGAARVLKTRWKK